MNKELEGKIIEILDELATEGQVYNMPSSAAASRIAALMPEPLAVLADKKGMKISKIENCHYPIGWLIHIIPKCVTVNEPIWQRYDKTIEIPENDNVDTYEQAESYAREYLEKLEDVK